MASRSALVCASNCVHNVLFRDAFTVSRILTCYQTVRFRKRSRGPASWHVRQKRYTKDEDLTYENEQFIKELVLDRYKTTDSPLKDEPLERGVWDPSTKRTGVLALKLGVIPQWDKNGNKMLTTLLQVLDNHVIKYKTPQEFTKSAGWKPWWGENYAVAVVGALSCEPHLFTKEYNNLFLEAGIPPKRKLTRFLITENAAIQPGTPLTAMHFRVGDFVDVQARTVDYGFQGVMKRWGFKGGPASHGTTKWHRRGGSIGGGGAKHGVWKGKKMPGHMGDDWTHHRGLKVLRINTKYNILYIKGTTPGPDHCYVRVMDTTYKKHRENITVPPPMPTFYPEDGQVVEEYFADDVFQFTDPSIQFPEEETKKK